MNTLENIANNLEKIQKQHKNQELDLPGINDPK